MCFWIFKRKKAKKAKEESHEEKKVEQTVEAEPAVKKEEPAPEPTQAAETKPQVKDIYHISLNKDEKNANFKRWRVRKQGSRKTIQHFDTQLEAINFAQDLADKAGGSIVIHKVDGTIRKQNYS